MLLPLTTAHDMNILNNCPVGHIPLGKLHVKMAFTDWILCLFYCLWTIMQFDIHQITNNYITKINLPIILVIDPVGKVVGNVRRSPTSSFVHYEEMSHDPNTFPAQDQIWRTINTKTSLESLSL